MEFSLEQFNKVKLESESFYNSIGFITCPYFNNEKIHFNSKGFEHLVFKKWNKTRSVQDQYSRFRHLKIAPEILKQSKTLQGIWNTQKFERIKKKDGSWQEVMKNTTYYEFIAVMESRGAKVRAKIIVKEILGGEKFFLSIIPFWGSNKNTGERVMYSGNPELD